MCDDQAPFFLAPLHGVVASATFTFCAFWRAFSHSFRMNKNGGAAVTADKRRVVSPLVDHNLFPIRAFNLISISHFSLDVSPIFKQFGIFFLCITKCLDELF